MLEFYKMWQIRFLGFSLLAEILKFECIKWIFGNLFKMWISRPNLWNFDSVGLGYGPGICTLIKYCMGSFWCSGPWGHNSRNSVKMIVDYSVVGLLEWMLILTRFVIIYFRISTMLPTDISWEKYKSIKSWPEMWCPPVLTYSFRDLTSGGFIWRGVITV